MEAAAARNLRTAERFLLAPPLAANFAAMPVSIRDISATGARLQHDKPLETGTKATLQVPFEGRIRPLTLEAMVVWMHSDSAGRGAYVSGVRTYGAADQINAFLEQLHASRRSNRIEELRSTDRFYVAPPIDAFFGEAMVRLEDLSKRGARIETRHQIDYGGSEMLRFLPPDSDLDVAVEGEVVWSGIKAIGTVKPTFRAGLIIRDKRDLLRLAIGHLCEKDRAVLDTHSLSLKLKIMRARARQLAASHRAPETSGIPTEQFLLIQGVREELRLNPEEAMHWYRRARITISAPATRTIAPHIADHPDALAVWEYLDRSIDPSIVGRAFGIPAI